MLAKRFYMCGYIPAGKRCTSFPCSKRIYLFVDRSDLCALVVVYDLATAGQDQGLKAKARGEGWECFVDDDLGEEVEKGAQKVMAPKDGVVARAADEDRVVRVHG